MAYNYQEQHDYADSLEPGYRFCPTDVELIVYYLKPKIDTGRRHPGCRCYEVNIYDYGPDELTAKPEYRSCEQNVWYFLTPRERKYPKGKRPNRQTKSGGTWKSSQAGKPQRDDMNQVVGMKTCLCYIDEKGNKTDWLMHEYTTDNPNIPIGSEDQKEDNNKFSRWVLCKIYKTKTNAAKNNVGGQEEAFEEQNQQLQDEPFPRRRRLSLNQESNQWNGPEHFPVQETNYHSERDVQMVEPVQFMLTSNQQSDLNFVHVGASQTFPTTSMNTSPNLVTRQSMAMHCGSKLTQPAVQDPQAFAMDQVQQPVGNDNDMAPVPHWEDIYDILAPLDHFTTSPAPSLAVQMDTSSNPMAMQQMVSSQTLRDEVLQQEVQNSYDDTPSLFNQSMIVPENDYSYHDKQISEDAMGYHPSEDCYSFDFLFESDDL